MTTPHIGELGITLISVVVVLVAVLWPLILALVGYWIARHAVYTGTKRAVRELLQEVDLQNRYREPLT